ncbi:MAG: SDR family oxidoreductase [Taibaiella sp.]|nr:SDR family oxidoreductase [Taibaiella sp.]
MAVFHTKDISRNAFLVTGGAGFIGSHIVEYLLHNNAGKVRVLDNLSTGSIANVELFSKYPQYEFVKGDIRDIEVCKAACEGIDYVTHQAALGSVPRSVKDPATSNDVNVGGFVNMISAAKDAGVKAFVYASSSSVYGDEPNLPKQEDKTGNLLSPYAVTKMTNELYAAVFHRLYTLNVVGLRYFNVFGPRQDPNGPYAAVIPLFVSGILNNNPVYINGDGAQTRDFTFVENAVQANIKGMLCEKPEAFGKPYNVAVGNNFSVNFLYNAIREMLSVVHEPTYREAREGDIHDSLANITRAQELLGYAPTRQFLDGLRITVDFFRNR